MLQLYRPTITCNYIYYYLHLHIPLLAITNILYYLELKTNETTCYACNYMLSLAITYYCLLLQTIT